MGSFDGSCRPVLKNKLDLKVLLREFYDGRE